MIEALQQLLVDHPGRRRWVIAYSGGLDSAVLLHLCASLRDSRSDFSPELLALHVNHGVQSEAQRWATHCQKSCDVLKVALVIRTLALEDRAVRAPSEDRLRQARYAVFEDFCAESDLLLLAHHRDDQAETVLLRLLRGAGVAGLAGMPRTRPCGRAVLVRPLLERDRGDLRDYARDCDLQWVEDPSNAVDRYARNFLRGEILSRINARWPGAGARMVRAAAHCAEAAELCADLAREDMLECCDADRYGRGFLRLERWRGLSRARSVNLLRFWLAQMGADGVDAAALGIVTRELIDAREDRQPQLRLGKVMLRRFRGRLYLLDMPVADDVPLRDRAIDPGSELRLDGVGRVVLHAVLGAGVCRGRRHELRFAHQGQFLREAGRPRKSVRRILQEAGVPPWMRGRVPLLYVDGRLAAVGDLCLAADCLAAAGEEGLRLEWSPFD